MSKNLVIVESPAKAKTIEKYLGNDFKVLSSVGHIRTDTKVDVEKDFLVTYEIDPGHKKIVSELKKATKSANTVWLATDEDREGESISWHLLEVLNLPPNTHRITFHEITPEALKHAIDHPRTVDLDMVYSQQARQTLDLLVGYDLSGVVRRKVPGAISAGRVQSPALRLIVEKEREIENFASNFKFKVTGEFGEPKFTAQIEKNPPATESAANELLTKLHLQKFQISSVDPSEATKNPPVPFVTASLQIEASSKLGFSSSTTMRAAQGLYQAGHITYHRTDSLNLSASAISQIANYIKQTFGEKYLKTRNFKTKDKSAQEAHEAIRPTRIQQEVAGSNNFEQKLYQLIRSRILATQMSPAIVAKTTVNLQPVKPELHSIVFTAKGEVILFDGFLKVYGKTKDNHLPSLSPGQILDYHQLTARQNFANPPARYTEGSLVKKLEELGIGRPSTYASIINAIQARGYVTKGDSEGTPREVIELTLSNQPDQAQPIRNLVEEKSGSTKGKLLPSPVGELVADFLVEHFEQIVDYGFTADIETKLDQIAEQKLEKTKMLRDFYTPFSKLIDYSAFIDRYNSATKLGIDPRTNKPVYAKIGKNGGFIQLGENEKESGEKPRFAPLPKNHTVKTITFGQALKQLELPALPRELGTAHDKTPLIAASGPFGPYLKAGSHNIPIKDYDPYQLTLEQAQAIYQAKLDSIIADWGEISIIRGAYGPYIKGPGRRNFLKIPKDQDPSTITLDQARELLAGKTKSSRHAPHTKTKAKQSKTKTTKTKSTKTRSTKTTKTPKKRPAKS